MLRPILVIAWLGWSLQTVSSQTNTQAVTTATPAHTTSAVYGCLPPKPPANGRVLERYLHLVWYRCDGGYVLNGWENVTCNPQLGDWISPNPPVCDQATDCPPPEPPVNGFTEGHKSGKVVFVCVGGYIRNGSESAYCDAEQGVWKRSPPTCEPSPYCSPPEPPLNGFTVDVGRTGPGSVRFLCYGGYILNGSKEASCLPELGIWYPPTPRCELASWIRVVCSPPEPPMNGFAAEGHGTVRFGCNDGYSLHGPASATCDALLGVWDAPTPLCEETLKPCPSVFDDFGIFWHGTPSGTQAVVDCIHLQDDLAGVISRSCSPEGDWHTPLYYCIRDTLAAVLEEIKQLLENPTLSSVEVALSKLANITSYTGALFEGEIKPIVELLETIVDYIDATSRATETEDFFSIADDLLGRVNEPAWERLIETASEQEGGFVVMRLIEQFAKRRVDSLAEGESRTLAGDHAYLQLVKLHSDNNANDNILFPSENGLATSDSYVYLPKTSLVGSTAYITVTYKHLTGIIPETYLGNHTGDLDLNSVVLSLTLLPNSHTALQDPVRLTYEHIESDTSYPTCSYWDYNRNSWSSDGCELVSTSEKISTCECDHLTNFALLMSPLAKPMDTLAISIITYVGCCLSCLFLIVTIGSHIFLWRYVKAGRVVILINLSTALIISYVVFLAGIRQTTNKDACTAVAVILQYIYLVVFFLMLAESIEIAVTVLYVFPTRSRLPWMIPLAWGIPAVIVAISAGAVRLEGYGTNVFCWLSTETSLIWAFAGPALVIILINFVILMFVMRAMFQTEAIKKSPTKAKAKTGIRCLCVLVPLMGLSWVLGIFYVSERHACVQYVFAVCNSLQGVVIFLFHCLFNEKIRSAIRSRRRRLSDSVPKSSTDSKLGKCLTMLDCVTICNPHKTHASTTADTAGSASQMVTPKSKTSGCASLADDALSLSAQQSDPTVPGDAATVPGDPGTQPALLKQTTETSTLQDADQPRLQEAQSLNDTTNTSSNAKPTTESTRVNSQEPSRRIPAQDIATQTEELQSDVFDAPAPAVATYVYQSQPKSQSLREAATQPLMSNGTNPVEQPNFVTTMNVHVTKGDVYEFRIQVPPSGTSNI